MAAAPFGALVRIFYDADPCDEVRVGDAIVTARTGRVYVVVSLRRQSRGAHAGRYHLACLVAAAVPDGAARHQLYWYPRS